MVDDDPQVVDLVRQLLEGECMKSPPCNSQEALEAIAEKRPDVILLDLLMPRMDGFGVIDQLQQDPQSRQIPVIVLTAKALTATERVTLDQTVRTVIQKHGWIAIRFLQELRGLLQPTVTRHRKV